MPVTSVTQSQVVDAAGNLSDVYEITYTIEGKPGTFTLTVPANSDAVEAARQSIADQEAQVLAIYGL